MSTRRPDVVDLSDESQPHTGPFIDSKSRSVQALNASGSSVGVNLSELGATILDVEPQDSLDLFIFQHGIWIPTDE